MSAILKIVCGASAVDLISPGPGLHLLEWQPAAPPLRDPLPFLPNFDHGGRPTRLVYDNYTETLTIIADHTSQDALIELMATLRFMLRKATLYWTDRTRAAPVYLMARASNETQTRYALITEGAVEKDTDPYVQPFLQPTARAATRDLTLVLGHQFWTETPPGLTAPVDAILTPTGGNDAIENYVSSAITASLDDIWSYVFLSGAPSDIVRTDALQIGRGYLIGTTDLIDSQVYLRFLLNVPAGAVVTSAELKLHADQWNVGGVGGKYTFSIVIRAEETDDSTEPAYSGADLPGRVFTAQYAQWQISESWIDGQDYYQREDDLVALLNQIISRPGWAKGNHVMLRLDAPWSTTPGEFVSASSWDLGHPPTLLVHYDLAPDYEVVAEVVANRCTTKQLTRVLLFDASGPSYAGVYPATAPVSHNLLPAVPAAGDAICFGITSTGTDYAPFSSLVFNIGTPYVGTCTIVWQYYNGSSWELIPFVADNTVGFTKVGVQAVVWRQADLTGWAAVEISGATGYWVRAVISAFISCNHVPTQIERNIYTPLRPYIDLPASSVPGNLEALGRLLVRNSGGKPDGSLPVVTTAAGPLDYNWLAIGRRSLTRGPDFAGYLPASDLQMPVGVTCTPNAVTGAYFTNASPAFPNEHAVCCPFTLPGGATLAEQCRWTISGSMAWQYNGNFRAFLRTKSGMGSNTITAKLRLTMGLNTAAPFDTPEVTWAGPQDNHLYDLGTLPITMPTYGTPTQIDLILYMSDTGGIEAYVFDLILLPADEGFWIASKAAEGADVNWQRLLDVDSIRDPRVGTMAYLRNIDSQGAAQDTYIMQTPGPLTWREHADQRIWFLTGYYGVAFITPEMLASPWMTSLVTVQRQARYLTARGSK